MGSLDSIKYPKAFKLMPELRQIIMILYLSNSAWTVKFGGGPCMTALVKPIPQRVIAKPLPTQQVWAMQDGWRVIQMPN